MTDDDRYGSDVLASFSRDFAPRSLPLVEITLGLVVEEETTGFYGAVTRREGHTVELEDYDGMKRVFPLSSVFLIDGTPVHLGVPHKKSPSTQVTPSGSRAVPTERARQAMASRIFVEGKHDAELVEKIWGDDLRHEGIVVEFLNGIDNLDTIVGQFNPTRGRRMGVLVDHLIPGTKESRIVEQIVGGRYADNVLVVGHPYIDVWEAIKPATIGLAAWPKVPHGTEWKRGACQALGFPHETQKDIALAWQRILQRVTSYADLEPALLGRVEELIDFVTETVTPL